MERASPRLPEISVELWRSVPALRAWECSDGWDRHRLAHRECQAWKGLLLVHLGNLGWARLGQGPHPTLQISLFWGEASRCVMSMSSLTVRWSSKYMVSTVSLELDPQAFRDLLMGRKKMLWGSGKGKPSLHLFSRPRFPLRLVIG